MSNCCQHIPIHIFQMLMQPSGFPSKLQRFDQNPKWISFKVARFDPNLGGFHSKLQIFDQNLSGFPSKLQRFDQNPSRDWLNQLLETSFFCQNGSALKTHFCPNALLHYFMDLMWHINQKK